METHIKKIDDYWKVRVEYRHQSFMLDFNTDDRGNAAWYAHQFEIAHNREIDEANEEGFREGFRVAGGKTKQFLYSGIGFSFGWLTFLFISLVM